MTASASFNEILKIAADLFEAGAGIGITRILDKEGLVLRLVPDHGLVEDRVLWRLCYDGKGRIGAEDEMEKLVIIDEEWLVLQSLAGQAEGDPWGLGEASAGR